MPRVLGAGAREKMPPWAGGLVAVVLYFAALLRGAMMPDLDTRLMAITLMCGGLIFLQMILGSTRRHSAHWVVQYGAMAAYYFTFHLAIYAVSTVRYSSDASVYHVSWCITLLLWTYHVPIFSRSLGMIAYTLGDSPFRDYRSIKSAFYFCLLSWNVWGRTSAMVIIVTAAEILGLLYSAYKWSCISSQQPCDAKSCADYVKMTVNSLSRSLDGDANNSHDQDDPFLQKYSPWVKAMEGLQMMNGCRPKDFSFNGPKKDFFISHSFSKLLTRRHFGFDCAEEGNAMVRDFMLKELLQDYKRSFTIIEAQLAILHGYFFLTRTPCESYSTRLVPDPLLLSLLAQLATTMIACCGDHLLAAQFAFVFTAIVCLLIWWWSSCQEEQLPDVFRRPYWKNEIGQYSLIEDYDNCSVKKVSLFMLKGIISSEWPPRFVKHHPVEEDTIRLPDNVRKLVALTLRDINGPPTNGTRSLQRNRDRTMDDLSWTCRQETHTHTILIWHIATCYCDMSPPNSYWPGNLRLVEISTCYEVATALSRYCAYLVAFLPEFLPEHKLTTQIVLQDVLKEAKLSMDQETWTIWKVLKKPKLLQGLTKVSMEEKRIKIRGLELPDEEAILNTFQKGVNLGRQLEKLNTLLRWKVMAEFWAETILYIAPSDNGLAH